MKKILSKIPKKSVKIINKNKSKHALIRGDSLKILKDIPTESINLIITDPPYNVNLDYGPYFKDKKDWDKYFNWCVVWIKECERILKKSGSMYIISYPEINGELIHFIRKDSKLRLNRWLTWHYPTNIGHSKKNWTRSQRSILFLTKGKTYTFNREKNLIQPYKNPDVGKIKKLLSKGKKGRASYDASTYWDLLDLVKEKQDWMADFLQINLLKNVSKERVGDMNKKSKFHHPCQLPLSLIKILIKVSSNKRDVILDPFAGTFTLTRVASDIGRNSIGIELNPYYIRLGEERLKNAKR